jgi:hypothetical protein
MKALDMFNSLDEGTKEELIWVVLAYLLARGYKTVPIKKEAQP